MLRAGQVFKLRGALFRVEYVNECRAKVVPLAKRMVALADGTEFEAAIRGHNISPNSEVEIVTDVERAREELELAAAERELAAAKREVELEAKIAATPPPTSKRATPATPRTAGGWHVAIPTTFRAGTLAAEVMAIIVATPGLTTKEVVALVKMEGAAASCVSRFAQAGLIVKV